MGMSKIAWASVAAAALLASSPVVAADLTPVPVPQVFDWNGFYAGVHLGWGWANADYDAKFFGFDIGSGSYDLDGFLGGAQIGYNWQNGAFVLGGELDITAAGIDGSSSFGPVDFNRDINWTSTARLRLGYAFDRLMVYGTGGGALAESKATLEGGGGDDSEYHLGWTIGAGAEWAMTQNIILRAEYLYMDFDRQDYQFNPVIGSDTDFTVQQARVGLNYKF